jgi:beta-glucosidase
VPQNGRNFEYISGEDPLLGYVLAKPAVVGIQSQGVLATVKHYVLNNQETDRGFASSNADEATRYEMYYPPFEAAVEAGVASAMVRMDFRVSIFYFFL